VSALTFLSGCDLCPGLPREGQLFAVVDGRRLCAKHWHALPESHRWPRNLPSEAESYEAELRDQARRGRR
jgi:hypothetical protein